MDLKQRFFHHLKEEKLIEPSDKVLIALSGGKDSVCLALLLNEAAKVFGFDLAACHIHHGIRGSEADSDAAFCQELCQTLNLPLFTEYCDAPLFCKENKIGLEEGARILRYGLLDEVAKREGFQKIATAHSASDQAETILFRLIRGSGFSGARGIPAKRGRIIRPILPFYAEEIEAFLATIQQPFTKDSSNSDTIYSRNLIRHDIFPLLEKINPRAKEALNRFGTFSIWQETMLSALWSKLEIDNGFSLNKNAIPLETAKSLAQDKSQYLLLFHGLSQLTKKHNISIDFVHFKAILSLLNHTESGKIIEISNGFCFKIEKKQLVFEKNEKKAECIEYEVELTEGENTLPFDCGTLRADYTEALKVKNINKKSLNIKLNSDKISGRLKARNFRPGDRIFMYGMHKSVKKMLCDSGIPKEYRVFIPIVCDDDEIVWIPFLGLCDKAREEDSKDILQLSLCGEMPETIRQFCENDLSKTL